jgi:hypothetical protein
MNLEHLIARTKDPGFQADVAAMTELGLDNPDITAFLMPLLAGRNTPMITHSGRRVNLLAPDPDTLDDHDIAHALAGEPRYASMTIRPYPISDHCLWVSDRVKQLQIFDGEVDPIEELTGHWHDAPEAMLKDQHKPLKQLLEPIYGLLEARMWRAMCARRPLLIGCKTPRIERADKEAAVKEALALLLSPPSWAVAFKEQPPASGAFRPGWHQAPRTASTSKIMWLARSNALMEQAAGLLASRLHAAAK